MKLSGSLLGSFNASLKKENNLVPAKAIKLNKIPDYMFEMKVKSCEAGENQQRSTQHTGVCVNWGGGNQEIKLVRVLNIVNLGSGLSYMQVRV